MNNIPFEPEPERQIVARWLPAAVDPYRARQWLAMLEQARTPPRPRPTWQRLEGWFMWERRQPGAEASTDAAEERARVEEFWS